MNDALKRSKGTALQVYLQAFFYCEKHEFVRSELLSDSVKGKCSVLIDFLGCKCLQVYQANEEA